jgi:hypothetical protein
MACLVTPTDGREYEPAKNRCDQRNKELRSIYFSPSGILAEDSKSTSLWASRKTNL